MDDRSPREKQKAQVEVLRQILHSKTPQQRLRDMSPENRALYEATIQLRDEVGRIDGFDIVAELREMRGGDDTSTCR
jgi:hypothetical protein